MAFHRPGIKLAAQGKGKRANPKIRRVVGTRAEQAVSFPPPPPSHDYTPPASPCTAGKNPIDATILLTLGPLRTVYIPALFSFGGGKKTRQLFSGKGWYLLMGARCFQSAWPCHNRGRE